MRCESCGAQLPQGQTVCDYCGTTCDQVGPVSAASDSVFRHIKQSAAWADRNSAERQASLPTMPALAAVAPIAFFVMFIAISGFIALIALGMSGVLGVIGFQMGGNLGRGIAIIPLFMALLPIGFVVLGIFLLIKQRERISEFQNAPTRSHAAVISGKRTQLSGGGGKSSASTYYFVTAQFEDGRREEFALMNAELYGRISEGDAGILFVRSRYALDFDRVI